MQLPFVSFADTKPRFLAKANKLIVGFEAPRIPSYIMVRLSFVKA
jgi:hypothetical protein